MAKYVRYEIATNIPDVNFGDIFDYKEAFSAFRTLASEKESRGTLWGIDQQGEYHCIMSFDYEYKRSKRPNL